jgi:hypothetical protein
MEIKQTMINKAILISENTKYQNLQPKLLRLGQQLLWIHACHCNKWLFNNCYQQHKTLTHSHTQCHKTVSGTNILFSSIYSILRYICLAHYELMLFISQYSPTLHVSSKSLFFVGFKVTLLWQVLTYSLSIVSWKNTKYCHYFNKLHTNLYNPRKLTSPSIYFKLSIYINITLMHHTNLKNGYALKFG